MAVHKDMRIGIIGGGFAGPTAALALAKEGFTNITLLEESSDLRSKGFSIILSAGGHRILKKLGVDASATPTARNFVKADFISVKGSTMGSVDVPQEAETVSYMISREDLHGQILEQLQQTNVTIASGKKVTNVAHGGEVERVQFEDGEEVLFDLVIGAGGIGSVARTTLYQRATQHYSDWSTWWFWFEGDVGFTQPKAFVGIGGSFAVYPLADGSQTVGAFMHGTPDSVMRADTETMRAYLAEKLQQFEGIDEIKEKVLSADAYFARRTTFIKVKQSYCGKTILIGDAEHAFSPILGLGTTLAIEDAVVLVRELTTGVTVGESLEQVFTRYNKKRKRRVGLIRLISGCVWAGANIRHSWQQVFQRIALAFHIPGLDRYLYKRIVMPDDI